jgi:glycine/D-amino acid oxidase-like deaminating enzyme
VIGGGVFGCCAAYQVAKAGAQTTLIERDRIGDHASGRNPGNLNPILATEPELIPLAIASFQLHLVLAKELALLGCASYGLASVRRILVGFDADDREELANTARRFAVHTGFSATPLNAGELHRLEHRLSKAVQEGLLIEGNKSLDSLAFNLAVAEGAQKAGAKIIRASAQGITHHRGTVTTVHTSAGKVACDVLILATGPWVAQAADWLGLDLSIRPEKGQLLRLRLRDVNITHDFTHGMISLYRRRNNEVWIGVTREQCGFDEMPTERGRRRLVEGAARIMPGIRDALMIEHVASLRPMTPNGLPVFGPAVGWNNVFVANGGGTKGMLLCTGIGNAIRDLIFTGKTTLPVRDAVC